MKRSELKVGDELYCASPSDWTYNRGERVVVVAVEPHEKRSGYGWTVAQRITEAAKGNGVLVDLDGPRNSGTPNRDVVQLGHLRGPYAQIHAEVQERAAADRAAKDDQEQRRNAARNEAAVLGARADAVGLDVSWVMSYRHDAATFHVPPAAMVRLLDAYEKTILDDEMAAVERNSIADIRLRNQHATTSDLT